MDLTHWYFAMFENPYEHVTDMMCRLRSRWRDMCSKLNMPYSIEIGAWPHASLSAIWALTCELIAARPVKPTVQKHIIAPWVALWSVADHDSTILHLHGCNDRWHSVAMTDVQTTEILQMLLEPQLHKAVLSAMNKLGGQSLPEIAFACARCSGLYDRHAHLYLRAAEKLGNIALNVLEECFLGQGFQLTDTLPAGAHEHYTYRCGRSKTRTDPRVQACTCRE